MLCPLDFPWSTFTASRTTVTSAIFPSATCDLTSVAGFVFAGSVSASGSLVSGIEH
jgi:hypothetical protein